ncbi:hypothetical protein GOQ29_13085 [Clostridium sp. D2Q-14]|uniref:hypothetical protein n=1 Tax=Anaeromonas gelatinilytica TaxID=2683194 RepID=UPI00193BA610|nr:hypothetical protein [Anaeromonas gelatinilytica]MBS4536552.1 hypothetical protein [Anaeromonas gelatinilytica]
MNWLRKFMTGRSGGDQLSSGLVILSIIFIIISRFTNWTIFLFFSYIPLAITIYRMFSKNIQKRRMENYKFMMLLSPVYLKFKKLSNRLGDMKTHKYFKCPNCKVKLRLPKNKGKIKIKCPKCNTEFIKKT